MKCIMCEKEAEKNEIYCEEHLEENRNEYCKEVSRAYWAEENEIKMGIHSSQVDSK
jgi:hypothetical protein